MEDDFYDYYGRDTVQVCELCDGDGADPGNDYCLPCPACDGEGRWQP